MFDNIKEALRLFFKSRLTVAAILMIAIFSILLWRMFALQIVNGAAYQDNYTLKIVKERTLNSTRGNIYDRNGNLLAYNELAYSITIEDNGSYSSDTKKNIALNAEIAQIITALEKNGDTITNEFRIDRESDGSYQFNVTEGKTAWKRFLADVYGKNSYDNLSYNKKLGYDTSTATAEQVMEYLSDRLYEIDETYESRLSGLQWHRTVIRNTFQRQLQKMFQRNRSLTSVSI